MVHPKPLVALRTCLRREYLEEAAPLEVAGEECCSHLASSRSPPYEKMSLSSRLLICYHLLCCPTLLFVCGLAVLLRPYVHTNLRICLLAPEQRCVRRRMKQPPAPPPAQHWGQRLRPHSPPAGHGSSEPHPPPNSNRAPRAHRESQSACRGCCKAPVAAAGDRALQPLMSLPAA